MKNSTEDPRYDLIGRLAFALYGQEITISLSALKHIMIEHGFEYSENSNRGMARSVSAAFHAWEKLDPVVHHAIAWNFFGKDGKPSWMHYEE